MPSFASMSCFIFATAALSPILPLTDRDPAAVAGDRLRDRRRDRAASPYLAGSVQVEVVDRHIRAEFGQPLGHHAPEAAARSGDEGDLAGEFLGHDFDSLEFEPRPIARMLAALRRIMASS